MALSVTKISGREHPEPDGAGFRTVRKVDFDSSYPTGGEAITDAQLGFSKAPDWVEIEPKSGYVFEYDGTNDKIKVFMADYDAVADGALIEANNTRDLSAVTGVIVKAYGRHAA